MDFYHHTRQLKIPHYFIFSLSCTVLKGNWDKIKELSNTYSCLQNEKVVNMMMIIFCRCVCIYASVLQISLSNVFLIVYAQYLAQPVVYIPNYRILTVYANRYQYLHTVVNFVIRIRQNIFS